MRRTAPIRRRAVVLTALLGTSVAVAAPAAAAAPAAKPPAPARTASTSAAGEHRGAAVTLDRLVEVITSLVIDSSSPSGPVVGDSFTYITVLHDGTGAVVGGVRGRCGWLFVRRSDGHLLGWCNETLALTGGTVRTWGGIDAATVFSGAVTRLAAVGVSGRYAGILGSREFAATPDPNVWQSRVVLRGHGRRTHV
jgi:hypothetical protein